MKFGILTLAFYGSRTLQRMLQNTGAFVDVIYLSHSPIPWSQYNNKARDQYRSDFDLTMLKALPFSEKIVLLEGVWETDELQRESALQQARADGVDYLVIQDADEFYLPEDFNKNLEGIRQNPAYPAYRCPWIVFWKSLHFTIQVRMHNGLRNQSITTCPNFAVNVNYPGVHFKKSRLVNEIDKAYMLEGLCLHLAWVLSDEEVLKKISTWGHSHQFDYMKFYKHKWLAWKPGTRYIGHITRANYMRAVRFSGNLPDALTGFQQPEQSYRPLNWAEYLDNFRLDMMSLTRVKLQELKKLLRRNSS